MTTKKATTTKPATKATVKAKVAKPKAALPTGATVGQLTIGQAIAAEMEARKINGANSVTVKNLAGQVVTIATFTQGIGNEPASNFNLGTIKFQISGKAA